MKNKLFFRMIVCAALAIGLVSVGCDNGTNGDSEPAKHTVTFDPVGGTITSGQAVQEVEEGKYAAIPAVTPPTGKEADGWTSSAPAIASPSSAITANVTFTAKWKDANLFIGGIWLHWDGKVNYKFTESGGAKVYSEAKEDTPTKFDVKGTYEFNATRKELTLRPEGGTAVVKSYEIDKSLLIFEKGKAGAAWYTKNPETGGGFNGDPAAAPLSGMWQNVDDDEDNLGFNKDGEIFFSAAQKNSAGKYWWMVMGTYEYRTDRKELTVWYNGIDDEVRTTPYTVEFTTADQVLKLTEKDGSITTFNKRDNL